jgi:hypothetical protein
MEAKKEIIDQIRQLSLSPDPYQARRELKHLFDEYEKLKEVFLEEQRKIFLDQQSELSEEEKRDYHFEPESDAIDKEFETTYRATRIEINERVEKQKEQQLKVFNQKLAIIKNITTLAQEENIARAFKRFNDLKEEWKNAGLASKNQERDLHDKHTAAVKEFYYHMNIYKELKAYDFEKNLEKRKKIIEESEEALKIESIQKKQDTFYKLQQQWYDAGPVSREDYEALQETWKSINDIFHEALGEYYEKLHTEQDDNLEKKKALVERVKQVDTSLLTTHSKWQKKTKQIIQLQKDWKKIGFARRKENEAVWKEFRAACDVFFKEKQVFYDQLKKEQDENRDKKRALLDRAKELADQTNWKDTTQEFIRLQKEWKAIPPAHHKEEKKLWNTFRETCNSFFDRKKQHFQGITESSQKNLEAAQVLLEELSKYVANKNKEDVIEDLKELSDRFNAIGSIPHKEKQKVLKAWKRKMDEIYSSIQLNTSEQIHIVFQQRVDQLVASDSPRDAIYEEKDRIRDKVDHLKSEVIQLENNMGFINSKDQSLIERLEKNINESKDEIAGWLEKMKLLNIALNKLNKEERE